MSDRVCGAPRCDRPIGQRARSGLCIAHQARVRRLGSLGESPVRAYGVTSDTATSKTCTRCKQEKPLTEFFRRSRSVDGYRPICKPCADAQCRTWRAANPERAAANLRFGSLRNRYGLGREQYQELLDAQLGRCAVCRTDFSASSLSPCVDHDHRCCPGDQSCGSCIRGLVCKPCNTMLGMAGDSIQTLAAAIRYLVSFTQAPPQETAA